MTKEELDNLIKDYKDGFVTDNELIVAVEEISDNIHDRQSLIDLAIYHIQHDNICLARHILNAVDNDWAHWYDYNTGMGTLDTPTAIKSVEDLYDYVED